MYTHCVQAEAVCHHHCRGLKKISEMTEIWTKKITNILQERLLVVENVILILNESDTENVEDAFGAGQGLAA